MDNIIDIVFKHLSRTNQNLTKPKNEVIPMKKTLLVLLFLNIPIFLFSQSQKLNIEEAENLFENASYPLAIKFYTKALDINESNSIKYYLYYKRASCYYMLKKYKNAIDDASQALKITTLDKDYTFVKGNAFWLIGRIHSRHDEKEKALSYFKYAAKILKSSLIINNVGYKQMQLEQYSKALKSFNESIKLDPSLSYSYNNRALVYLKLEEINLAKKDIIKAKQLSPQNPYIYKHSALIYLYLNEKEKACAELQKAKELNYSKFGSEADAHEVDKLLNENCGIQEKKNRT